MRPAGDRTERSSSAGAPSEVAFVRQMGLTQAEFFRILPPVVAGLAHRVTDDAVHVEDGDRQASLTLGPEGTRSLGMLRLPGFELRFSFSGFTEAEVAAFMTRFETTFHRGGG